MRDQMNSKLHIGIIGLGGAGRAHILRFKSNPKVEIVALYDPKRSVLDEVVSMNPSLPIKLATSDINELFCYQGIDAVSICSPDHAHAEHALQAIHQGWHVLCEKPLTDSISNCEKILQALEGSNLKFMVHHQWRYVPAFQRARDIVQSGILGNVFEIEADYFHDMTDRATKFDTWRIDPDHPQNIIFGGACHPIDLMQWCFNQHIVQVFAYANHIAFKTYPDYDHVTAILRFAGGQVGKVTMSIGCKRPQYQRLVILGDQGTIVNNLLLDKNGLKKVLRYPAIRSRSLIIFMKNFIKNMIGRLACLPGVTINYPFGDYYEHDLASERLMDDFIDCILLDKTVTIPISESADAIRVCQAVIESYQSGNPVVVKRES